MERASEWGMVEPEEVRLPAPEEIPETHRLSDLEMELLEAVQSLLLYQQKSEIHTELVAELRRFHRRKLKKVKERNEEGDGTHRDL